MIIVIIIIIIIIMGHNNLVRQASGPRTTTVIQINVFGYRSSLLKAITDFLYYKLQVA